MFTATAWYRIVVVARSLHPRSRRGDAGIGLSGQQRPQIGRAMSLEQARAFALEDPGTPLAAFRLTRRELQVARLVRQGLTDPQIANRLSIATRTAEGHVESLRNKLGVNSWAEVAA